jgi:hypothetical protein
MIRLEKYKRKVFFDYKSVETYLNQMRCKNRGAEITGS